MKKIKIAIAASTIVMFGLFGVIGCSGGGGGSDAPVTAQDIVNTTDGNNVGSGVSSDPQITVENGTIIVNVTDGKFTINGDNVTLTELNGATWTLVDGVSITVTNNSGTVITGTVTIDPDTGDIIFTPDSGNQLNVSETYTITVTVNGTPYTATVIVAVDETNEEESMFANVPFRGAGTFAITDLIVNGNAIFGWQFGSQFKIQLLDVDAGATVYLTAYGIYNIAGQQNKVYYQRWESDNTIVKDHVWITNSTTNTASSVTYTVNANDTSLDTSENDYSFAATYFELRVMKDGADITAASTVKIKVTEN